jgi:hypothetical protein
LPNTVSPLVIAFRILRSGPIASCRILENAHFPVVDHFNQCVSRLDFESFIAWHYCILESGLSFVIQEPEMSATQKIFWLISQGFPCLGILGTTGH